jgi:hypothetical protein
MPQKKMEKGALMTYCYCFNVKCDKVHGLGDIDNEAKP